MEQEKPDEVQVIKEVDFTTPDTRAEDEEAQLTVRLQFGDFIGHD
jgi:hypothetical protein